MRRKVAEWANPGVVIDEGMGIHEDVLAELGVRTDEGQGPDDTSNAEAGRGGYVGARVHERLEAPTGGRDPFGELPPRLRARDRNDRSVDSACRRLVRGSDDGKPVARPLRRSVGPIVQEARELLRRTRSARVLEVLRNAPAEPTRTDDHNPKRVR